MYEIGLQISFISDWHIGSGFGSGAIADAVINRDVNGIPWIPGSALKGALREASWRLAMCDESALGWLTEFFFGKESQADTENQPGRFFVGDGNLAPDFYAWLMEKNIGQRQECVTDMTVIHQQTELDQAKMVVPQSLRAIECGIPGITFSTTLEAIIAPEWEKWFAGYLKALCGCVKSMGGYRARGIGKCRMWSEDLKLVPLSIPNDLPESLLQHKPRKK